MNILAIQSTVRVCIYERHIDEYRSTWYVYYIADIRIYIIICTVVRKIMAICDCTLRTCIARFTLILLNRVCVYINARGMSYYYNATGGWFI